MGINQIEVDTHWNYFLAIEEDFLRISRYVHFNTANNKAYSIEFARIILAAGSEVDVVAKALTNQITGKDTENIAEHRKAILPAYPEIPEHTVSMDRSGMTVTPWENWGAGKSPDWWSSYNTVKHNRGRHFQEANLENTFRSVAGLFILLIYHLRQMEAKEVHPPPRILSTEETFTSFATDPRRRIFLLYPLNS
ncbi:hypothetical protein QSH18_10765 [Xanthomonas sp. NCPPB 2654]|uniref:hypothetical protein n=1 Tax=unclassified Xanthomonas TaxID=2643310 RepID=UPI0021DF6966|nr:MULTISPECIES: hypothetical protein [unclassified Xanthomonas]MDL5366087.1 hypothetical protein [Xanthomonas sp. NCPPB 2654]UYC20784.1 hypothetical protein NUG20_00265 [Xanthomonas sp. CFBP 8443]